MELLEFSQLEHYLQLRDILSLVRGLSILLRLTWIGLGRGSCLVIGLVKLVKLLLGCQRVLHKFDFELIDHLE